MVTVSSNQIIIIIIIHIYFTCHKVRRYRDIYTSIYIIIVIINISSHFDEKQDKLQTCQQYWMGYGEILKFEVQK